MAGSLLPQDGDDIWSYKAEKRLQESGVSDDVILVLWDHFEII